MSSRWTEQRCTCGRGHALMYECNAIALLTHARAASWLAHLMHAALRQLLRELGLHADVQTSAAAPYKQYQL